MEASNVAESSQELDQSDLVFFHGGEDTELSVQVPLAS